MCQYLKAKRHKYGLKLFKFCCYGLYDYNVQFYAGKNLLLYQTTPMGKLKKLGGPVLVSGRTMITDNWYTRLSLAEKLVFRLKHLTWIIRNNRECNPNEVVKKS